MTTSKRDVLLVGGVRLANAEEVFRTVGEILGDRIPRIPDGETGIARGVWIQCQLPFFLGHPQLEMVEPVPERPGEYRAARIPSGGLYSYTAAGRYQGRARLRAGVSASELHFDNLGYADWAEESYATFKRLKAAGAVPAGARFQVSIPSPRAILNLALPEEQAKIQPALEAGIFHEVARIAAAIPNDELSIQWDCTHPAQYESGSAEERREIDALLLRLGNAVPASVELGYHLCYGDFEHRHARQPIDMAAMVAMANNLASRLPRAIGWVHMPVPRDRSDDAYFAPLRDLELAPETRLYLGLVHYTDGVEGGRRRIAAASKARPEFGIATECGFTRRPASQDIRELLRLHAQLADAA